MLVGLSFRKFENWLTLRFLEKNNMNNILDSNVEITWNCKTKKCIIWKRIWTALLVAFLVWGSFYVWKKQIDNKHIEMVVGDVDNMGISIQNMVQVFNVNIKEKIDTISRKQLFINIVQASIPVEIKKNWVIYIYDDLWNVIYNSWELLDDMTQIDFISTIDKFEYFWMNYSIKVFIDFGKIYDLWYYEIYPYFIWFSVSLFILLSFFLNYYQRYKNYKRNQDLFGITNMITESTSNLIFLVDETQRIVYVNKTALDKFSVDLQDVIWRNIHELIIPKSRLKEKYWWIDDFEKVINMKDWSWELETILTDRTWVEFPARLMFRRVIRNSKALILAIIIDQKELKEFEKKLQLHIRFISALLDQLPTPVYYKEIIYKDWEMKSWDSIDHFVLGLCNNVYSKKIWIDKIKAIWKPMNNILIDKSLIDYHKQKDKELYERWQIQPYMAKVSFADWYIHLMLFHKWLLYDESGSILWIIWVMYDITELEEKRIASEASDRAKSEFLAMIWDDLKTPLNSIIWFSEMIIMALKSWNQVDLEKISWQLEAINESWYDLFYKIADILEFSKLELGNVTIKRKSMKIHTCVENAIKKISEKFNSKKILLNYNYNDSMDIYNDTDVLGLIVYNLLDNSLKFTEPLWSVSVRARIDINYDYIVEIEDTGIWIPEDKIEFIQRPFIQLQDEMSRKYSWRWLGLAVVNRYLKLVWWKLKIESKVWKWTKVTIIFSRDSKNGFIHTDLWDSYNI